MNSDRISLAGNQYGITVDEQSVVCLLGTAG